MLKEKKKGKGKTKYKISSPSRKKKNMVKESDEHYFLNPPQFEKADANFFTIKEASEWASKEFGKTVTTSNISYLIQYGRVKKIATPNKEAALSRVGSFNYQNHFELQFQLSLFALLHLKKK